MERRARLPLCPMPAVPTYRFHPMSTYHQRRVTGRAFGGRRGTVRMRASATVRNGTVTLPLEALSWAQSVADEEPGLNADAPKAGRSFAGRTCSAAASGFCRRQPRSRRRPKRCFGGAISFAEADRAETLVALGGDGFMLQTLHQMLAGRLPKAGVRDEPRHRRLPDERLADRPAARADRGGQGDPRRAAANARDDRVGRRNSPMRRSTKSRC